MKVTPPKEYASLDKEIYSGLTPGKKYKVTGYHTLENRELWYGRITDDNGEFCYINSHDCAHLGGLDWVVLE